MSGYRVIGASAGTGKTHRLTSLVIDALGQPGSARPSGRLTAAPALAPEGIVGVTFTKKAAGELAERLRTRLHAAGEAALAQRLGMAWLGTVHSVGLRLIEEYAIEAGLAPEVGVLPDDGGRFLHALLEQVVSEERQRDLDDLVWRLRIRWDGQKRTVDWQKDVFELIDAARSNRIDPDALTAMAGRSWTSLSAYLDPVDTTRDLDAELAVELDAARAGIDLGRDTTNNTRSFLERFEQRRDDLVAGIWEPWASYAKLDLGKASYAFRDRIRVAAARVLAHPRLHADLRAYLEASAVAASETLRAFAAWKASAHVVDHTDQLDLAWRLLGDAAVASELRATLGLVVVDELQDSNPLQLALFTRLHELAGSSVWVGDPKQCIFEWNGADPALVDVVLDAVRSEGGEVERLDVNRRSRTELVAFTSTLFAAAFVDLAPADVVVSAHRVDPPELAALPPVGLAFHRRDVTAPTVLAELVAGVLAAPDVGSLPSAGLLPHDTPVVDRETGRVRPPTPGDIAILVPTNDECAAVRAALEHLGIRAATAQNGLLGTPEARALRAALAMVIAPDDALAEAELEALLGREGTVDEVIAARDAWLAARLAQVAPVPNEGRAPGRWSTLLEPVRAELAALSPSAVVERVFAALDMPRRVLGWPYPAARRDNLDALRALAARYEGLESARQRPLTLTSLLRAFAAVGDNDPHTPLVDEQHVGAGDDAVQVMTYHRAKGLEWPVVILGGLDRNSRRSAFSIACESDATAFSLADPLASRWVRHWPWPFAPLSTGELERRVAQSPIGLAVAERERRERIRILYVGLTRARDHLILTIPENDKGLRQTEWLDELARDGQRVWDFTSDATRGLALTAADGQRQTVRTRLATRARTARQPAGTSGCERTEAVVRPRRDLSPSRATIEDVARIGARLWAPRGRLVALGPPLAVELPPKFSDWDRFGTALHGFFASDRAAHAADLRLAAAERWLSSHGTAARIGSAALVGAADRLEQFVTGRAPGAVIHREIPIVSDIPDGTFTRRLTGVIDMLVEVPDGYYIIDHKSFPAGAAAWKRARDLAAQLSLYAHALARLPDARPVLGMWLHFPIAGVLVPLG